MIKKTLPKSVWMLGLVSLFMDMSSELIHAVLPLYLTTVLGVSVLAVGLIEGVAEATASLTKLFSGAIADRLQQRKLLTVIGYGLAAVTKPIFPLAQTLEWVVAARFMDRFGKGIRGAPRDALIAEVTPPEQRGAAFGLRQSLDTVGAAIGPLLAVILLVALAGDLRSVLWIAVVPAVVAVAILVFCVQEPKSGQPRARPKALFAGTGSLPSAFWVVVAIGGALTLARFSEAFLILQAQHAGMGITWAPLVMVVMAVAYALTSYPAGKLSDRVPRHILLTAGLITLIAADLVLAGVPTTAGVMTGATLWGIHMGLTQGLLATLVADAAPAHLRGTAFGVFYFNVGVLQLAASALAGLLWSQIGPASTFLAGAAFSALALGGCILFARHKN